MLNFVTLTPINVQNPRTPNICYLPITHRTITIRSSAQPSKSKSQSHLQDTETSLISIITGLKTHITPTNSENHKEICECVTKLENQNGFSRAPPLELISGKWQLSATDSKAVYKNKGSVTGFPGVSCNRVVVDLQKTGRRARTIEDVSAFWGLWGFRNVLEGGWSVDDRGSLSVTYAKLKVFGEDGLEIRSDSKAVLKTSYCSDLIRIGRSGMGEFYVFMKIKDKI